MWGEELAWCYLDSIWRKCRNGMLQTHFISVLLSCKLQQSHSIYSTLWECAPNIELHSVQPSNYKYSSNQLVTPMRTVQIHTMQSSPSTDVRRCGECVLFVVLHLWRPDIRVCFRFECVASLRALIVLCSGRIGPLHNRAHEFEAVMYVLIVLCNVERWLWVT